MNNNQAINSPPKLAKASLNYLIPFLLFIFSFSIRLSLISKGPYHIDCLNLALQAQETLKTHQLHYLFGFGYPLTVLLGSFFVAFTNIFSIDDPVLAINLMSVFFSSLCVVANFLFAKKFFHTLLSFPLLNRTPNLPAHRFAIQLAGGPAASISPPGDWELERKSSITALVSSLLLNVLPSFLGVSIYGTSHTPCLFFLLTGLYFLMCYLENKYPRDLFLASLAVGFMGANRLQDLILMSIPISFLFFLKTGQGKKHSTEENTIGTQLKTCLIFWTITSFIVILFHLPFLIGPAHTSYHNQLSAFYQQAFGPNFRGILSPSLLRSLAFLIFNLFPLGLILAAGGFYQLRKQSTMVFVFLSLWFWGPLLFYGNLHSAAPRFLIISMIPLVLALGYMVSSIAESNTIFKRTPVLLLFLLEFLMFSNIYPILAFRHDHDSLPEFARWVAKLSEQNALIIAGDEGFFIEHYGHRALLYRPANAFDFKDTELLNFKQKLDDTLARRTPVYIDANGLYSYDAEKKFSNLIKKNYHLTFLGKKIIEEWYPGEIFKDIQWQGLFKITPK